VPGKTPADARPQQTDRSLGVDRSPDYSGNGSGASSGIAARNTFSVIEIS
jgi:hypothetical protein